MLPIYPVLVGPTASGKTAVAHAVARVLPVGILSADSRQVYRRLDIGTAKPTAADRSAFLYHGLDVVEPHQTYAAGRFARDAGGWIAAIEGLGRLPLVVGGTGFYLRALFEGLFEEPPLDAGRRAALRTALRALSAEERQRWATRLDPGYRGGRNAQRAARAIEISLLAGRPLSALQREHPSRPAARPWYARLTLPRELLQRRIETRTRDMLKAGFIDEVREELRRGTPGNAPGLTGVGYREVIRHLAGELPFGRLEEAIVVATRQYAKRQETWFRHQLPDGVLVLDGTQPPDALAAAVLSGYRAACA